MFTKMIMAVGLTWITLFSPAAYAQTQEEQICGAVANIIEAVAGFRDQGEDPNTVYYFLLSQGVPQSIAQEVMVLVYSNLSVSGEIMAKRFYEDCTSEAL